MNEKNYKNINAACSLKSSGFTLVELLLAITVFAVLTTTGWLAINQLIHTKASLKTHITDLTNLQDAYSFMIKDFNQAMPVSDTVQQVIQPAMTLMPVSVNFVKAPVEIQGLVLDTELSRIEYRLIDNTLWRSRYRINRLMNADSLIDKAPILKNIQQLTFEAFNPEITTNWPTQQLTQYATDSSLSMDIRKKAASVLPKAIKVKIIQNNQQYDWILPISYITTSSEDTIKNLIAQQAAQKNNNTGSANSTNTSNDSNNNANANQNNGSTQTQLTPAEQRN